MLEMIVNNYLNVCEDENKIAESGPCKSASFVLFAMKVTSSISCSYSPSFFSSFFCKSGFQFIRA